MLNPYYELKLLLFLRVAANAVLLGGFVVMLAGELLFPRRPGDRPYQRLPHGLQNLIISIAGVVMMSIVYGSSIWFILSWLQTRGVGVLFLLHLPIWLHAILAFALLDVCDYTFHRLSHNVRWLWLMHAVHHSDPNMDVTTNLRQHPLHLLFTQLWKFVVCAAIGVPVWVFLIHEIIALAFAHLHHAAIRWPRWIDKAFSWILVTPRLHWSHHSPDMSRTNSNYSMVMSIWDRIFGTLTAPGEPEQQFGLASLNAASWSNAWGMLLTPWRARKLRQF